jgi:heptaprenyl diphosphate synthase
VDTRDLEVATGVAVSAVGRDVDGLLRDWLADLDVSIAGAMGTVAFSGGKRVRPILVRLFSELAAQHYNREHDSTSATKAGAAVELVHVGSLVHDDIMDDARDRRGAETIHVTIGRLHTPHIGRSQAIIAGDLFLAHAGRLAAALSAEVSASLADAIYGLCIGQGLEFDQAWNTARSVEEYYSSIAGKTGALLATSCEVGVLSQGAQRDDSLSIAATEFGNEFGLAFQVIDDVLDFASSEDLLGKPVLNDVKSGVYTLPILLMEDRSELRPNLTALAQAVEAARRHARRASEVLLATDCTSPREDDIRSVLADFPRQYIEQMLTTKVRPELMEALLGGGSQA